MTALTTKPLSWVLNARPLTSRPDGPDKDQRRLVRHDLQLCAAAELRLAKKAISRDTLLALLHTALDDQGESEVGHVFMGLGPAAVESLVAALDDQDETARARSGKVLVKLLSRGVEQFYNLEDRVQVQAPILQGFRQADAAARRRLVRFFAAFRPEVSNFDTARQIAAGLAPALEDADKGIRVAVLEVLPQN